MAGGPVREREHTRRLCEAPLEVVGRFANASNATLLVRLTDHDPRGLDELARDLGREPEIDDLEPDDLAVYKPQRGERPLWDFPPGTLHRREVAASVVSDALGWDLVPATVVRDDAPFGVGSLQRFVAHDPDDHYFTLLDRGDPGIRDQLRAMVVFDLMIDNADRKGGHVLLERPGASRGSGTAVDPGPVRLVDHGVTFNAERKLRTVGWDFAGEPVPAALHDDIARLCDGLDGELGEQLTVLLSDEEVERLRQRVVDVLALSALPEPTGAYPYPWPLL